MKKRSLIAILLMAVLTIMCFTACGKDTKTLETYAKDNPDVQKSIDDAMKDSNVQVEIKGNEIIYTFDLSVMENVTEESAKSDEVKKGLEDGLTNAASTFGGISKTLEEQTEISGISTTINYKWGDEVLVTKTFTAADADAAPAEDTTDAAKEAEEAAEDTAEEAEGEGE